MLAMRRDGGVKFKIEHRCRAKLPKTEGVPYYGRCDLFQDHDGPHVLERGMDEIRFEIRILNHYPPTKPPRRFKIESDEEA